MNNCLIVGHNLNPHVLLQTDFQISGSFEHKNHDTPENIYNDLKSRSDDTTRLKMYKMISVGSSDMCVLFCSDFGLHIEKVFSIFFSMRD